MGTDHSPRQFVASKSARTRRSPARRAPASDEAFALPGSSAHLLHLQHIIGNAAVQRLLQRDVDEMEYSGRYGVQDDTQTADTPAEAPAARSSEGEDAGLENAIRPDEPDDDIFDMTITSYLVRLLPTLELDDLRHIYTTLSEPPITGAGDLVALNVVNIMLHIPANILPELQKQVGAALADKLKETLHVTRQSLVIQMNNLEDETQRRQLLTQIRGIDAPILRELREINNQHPSPTPWKHAKHAVQDSLLAALQLAVMLDAERYLDTPQQAEANARKPFGMGGDWCGMFAALNYLTEGLDADMKSAFLHVDNLVDFFNYVYNRNPDRIKKWIYAEDRWWEVKEYHEHRSAKRGWIDAKQIFDGGALDIRPGDIVLLDHKGETNPDHIQMVQSYNPRTRQLVTIGGNDGGYVVDNDPNRQPADPKSDEGKMEAATGRRLKRGGFGGHVGIATRNLGQQPDPQKVKTMRAAGKTVVRVFAIGRPSIVDLENHTYHKANSPKEPTEKPPGL